MEANGYKFSNDSNLNSNELSIVLLCLENNCYSYEIRTTIIKKYITEKSFYNFTENITKKFNTS